MSNQGKILTVHKTDAEGTIQVDGFTGKILTDLNERPDWAEGFAAAVPQERLKFYSDRLGADSKEFKEIEAATTINVEDLSFASVNAEQEETETYASEDFRMETVSKALGLDRDTGDLGTTLAEREISRENRGRTQNEINALQDAVDTGFGKAAEGQQKATGTN